MSRRLPLNHRQGPFLRNANGLIMVFPWSPLYPLLLQTVTSPSGPLKFQTLLSSDFTGSSLEESNGPSSLSSLTAVTDRGNRVSISAVNYSELLPPGYFLKFPPRY